MANSLLMQHIAPGLGCVVAWMLFASPCKAVLAVRQQKALGSLNPLPMVAMWANCVAWLCYSFLTVDPYVLASNIPGVLLAAFMTVSCYGFADERTRNTMLAGVMFFVSLLMGAGIAISFGGFDHKGAVKVWGSTTVLVLIMFYSAPLSALAEVLRSRSSAALYLPFAAMNLANGLLWTAYGLAVPDAFIYGPNVVGAVFATLQVVLCLVFPARPAERHSKPTASPAPEDSELGNMLQYDAPRS